MEIIAIMPPKTAHDKIGLFGSPCPLKQTIVLITAKPNMLENNNTVNIGSCRLFRPPIKSEIPQPMQAASDNPNAYNNYSSKIIFSNIQLVHFIYVHNFKAAILCTETAKIK